MSIMDDKMQQTIENYNYTALKINLLVFFLSIWIRKGGKFK